MAFSGAAQFAALTLFRDTYCRFDRGHLLAWCLEFDALWALCLCKARNAGHLSGVLRHTLRRLVGQLGIWKKGLVSNLFCRNCWLSAVVRICWPRPDPAFHFRLPIWCAPEWPDTRKEPWRCVPLKPCEVFGVFLKWLCPGL